MLKPDIHIVSTVLLMIQMMERIFTVTKDRTGLRRCEKNKSQKTPTVPAPNPIVLLSIWLRVKVLCYLNSTIIPF